MVILSALTRVARCSLILQVVGHQVVTDPATGSFVQPEPRLGYLPPLLPMPLDTVHINNIHLAFEPLKAIENSGVIAQRQKQPRSPSACQTAFKSNITVPNAPSRDTGI